MVNIILTALKVFGNFKHYERIRDGNPPPLTKVGLEVYLKYKRLIYDTANRYFKQINISTV